MFPFMKHPTLTVMHLVDKTKTENKSVLSKVKRGFVCSAKHLYRNRKFGMKTLCVKLGKRMSKSIVICPSERLMREWGQYHIPRPRQFCQVRAPTWSALFVFASAGKACFVVVVVAVGKVAFSLSLRSLRSANRLTFWPRSPSWPDDSVGCVCFSPIKINKLS